MPTSSTKSSLITPVYRVRLHAEMFSANTNDSNRGRICIGNMAFYPSEYHLPLSGDELDYEPGAWNGSGVGNYNCYAYVFNTKNHGYMQPGQSVGHTSWTDSEITSPATVLNFVQQDSNNYGFVFKEIAKTEPAGIGRYKVALVIDNQYEEGDLYKYDYHWYRQNSDGTWSHKPGGGNVIESDYSSPNQIIYDPETCNRDAGNGLCYNLFVGFYQVTPIDWGFL